jgi:hypothetical protein
MLSSLKYLKQAKQLMTLCQLPTRSFTIVNRELMDQNEYLMDPIMDLYTMKMKKIMLDRSILEKHRILVPPVRLRREDDTLELCRRNKLTPGVILARDEFEDVDLVFDVKQPTQMRRRKEYKSLLYTVPVGDENITCTINKILQHEGKHWFYQVAFNRFIVGRPNPVYVPFKLKYETAHSVHSYIDFELIEEGMWIMAYHENYPVALEVETGQLKRGSGLLLGDLIQTLPNGVEAHPMYQKQKNKKLLTWATDATSFTEQINYIIDYRKQLEKEEEFGLKAGEYEEQERQLRLKMKKEAAKTPRERELEELKELKVQRNKALLTRRGIVNEKKRWQTEKIIVKEGVANPSAHRAKMLALKKEQEAKEAAASKAPE